MNKIRLDKLLSDYQFGTRSEIKKLIRDKQVKVNNQLINDSSIRVSYDDLFSISDTIYQFQKYVYLMMNKPKGFECSHQSSNRTIYELLKEEHLPNDLFTVGRLDLDTTGLLLITNDGDWAHQITSKKNHSTKKYLVSVDEMLDERINRLNSPITLQPEGDVLAKNFTIKNNKQLVISINDGKYHQVKRMIVACGYQVVNLERLSIGQLSLDKKLSLGGYRHLDAIEKELVFDD